MIEERFEFRDFSVISWIAFRAQKIRSTKSHDEMKESN